MPIDELAREESYLKKDYPMLEKILQVITLYLIASTECYLIVMDTSNFIGK